MPSLQLSRDDLTPRAGRFGVVGPRDTSWHTTNQSRLIPTLPWDDLFTEDATISHLSSLRNLRSPMWSVQKALEERSVHPPGTRFQVFPAHDKMRCVCDYLTSIITSPPRATLAPPTCIIIRPARATSTSPTNNHNNNRLTPENEVFAEPVTHLPAGSHSFLLAEKAQPLATECDYTISAAAERARRVGN